MLRWLSAHHVRGHTHASFSRVKILGSTFLTGLGRNGKDVRNSVLKKSGKSKLGCFRGSVDVRVHALCLIRGIHCHKKEKG